MYYVVTKYMIIKSSIELHFEVGNTAIFNNIIAEAYTVSMKSKIIFCKLLYLISLYWQFYFVIKFYKRKWKKKIIKFWTHVPVWIEDYNDYIVVLGEFWKQVPLCLWYTFVLFSFSLYFLPDSILSFIRLTSLSRLTAQTILFENWVWCISQ